MSSTTIWGIMLVSAMLLSAGCASIVSRSKYNIPLQANMDAVVEVRNRGELVTSVRAPTTLTLSSDAGFFTRSCYTFTFKKEGYPDVVKHRNAYVNGWYLGNLVFGGLIGMVIIDPATGAMWRLDEKPVGVHYEFSMPSDMTEKTR